MAPASRGEPDKGPKKPPKGIKRQQAMPAAPCPSWRAGEINVQSGDGRDAAVVGGWQAAPAQGMTSAGVRQRGAPEAAPAWLHM